MTNDRGLTGSGRRSVSMGPNDPRARRNGQAFLGNARHVKAPIKYRDGQLVLGAGEEFEVDAQGQLRLRLAAPILLRDGRLSIDLTSLPGGGESPETLTRRAVTADTSVAEDIYEAFRSSDEYLFCLSVNPTRLHITMPKITGSLSNRIRRIKSSTASTWVVTIDPEGSQTIEAASTLTLNGGEVVTLTHDGSSNWEIL